MISLKRATKFVTGATMILAALFVGGVYLGSEMKMARKYSITLQPPIENPSPDISQGERMAKIVGCWAGCHGLTGEGGTEEISGIREITAPTLSQVLPEYTDAELIRLVRYGVKKDGKSAIGMSSFTFWAIGDIDLANIIHFLRQQPSLPAVPRALEIPFQSRLKLLTGQWQVSADQVNQRLPRWGNMPRETQYQRGRYLAAIVCAECHGVDYQGDPLEGGPSLAILAVYDLEQFSRLMKTGLSQGDRLVEAMAWVIDVDFTDQDISDVYHFLRE